MLTYTVKLEPQKEGGFAVIVPSLPGCISEGDTLKEALENIKDAIEGYLLTMAKHERKIPIEISKFTSVEIFKTSSFRKNRDLVHA